ncbi:hypothetical protein [uncultured Sunxiuqinia sp.]|uniref:hypothetical protein n=1 Tax=uncultured Sunxiuqinia sp. TaxID=1573825 RepID=UPI002AA79B86|nr:hypothetical protein [uncultured Sunxiuqinia sp.]
MTGKKTKNQKDCPKGWSFFLFVISEYRRDERSGFSSDKQMSVQKKRRTDGSDYYEHLIIL